MDKALRLVETHRDQFTPDEFLEVCTLLKDNGALSLLDVHSVQQAIEHGLDPNTRDFDENNRGDTFLMKASFCGNVTMVKMLLGYNDTELNLQNILGYTALMLAVSSGHEEIVSLLLDHGAEVNIWNSQGLSALHIAILNKNTNIAKLLIDEGIDCNLADRNGNTPLMWCCNVSLYDVAEYLLDNGAQVNKRDLMGYSSLCTCVSQNDTHMARILLSHGATVHKEVHCYMRFSNSKQCIEEIERHIRRRRFMGLLRTMPMMMLWRKRATERLYHPRRMEYLFYML